MTVWNSGGSGSWFDYGRLDGRPASNREQVAREFHARYPKGAIRGRRASRSGVGVGVAVAGPGVGVSLPRTGVGVAVHGGGPG